MEHTQAQTRNESLARDGARFRKKVIDAMENQIGQPRFSTVEWTANDYHEYMKRMTQALSYCNALPDDPQAEDLWTVSVLKAVNSFSAMYLGKSHFGAVPTVYIAYPTDDATELIDLTMSVIKSIEVDYQMKHINIYFFGYVRKKD